MMLKTKRSFTPEFKTQTLLEVIGGIMSAAEVCREHKIKPPLLSPCKSYFLENASSLFDSTQRRSEERARFV